MYMDNKNEVELYKGQSKDPNLSIESNVFFKNDPQLFFVYKKTEKLTRAIYMITDLFTVREPMRWRLRTKAVSMMSLILSKPHGHLAQETHDHTYAHPLNLINEVVVLLEFAMRVHLVSPMNFSILREEFLSLEEVLRNREKEPQFSKSFVFPDRFFDTSEVSKNMPISPRLSYATKCPERADKGQKDSKRHVLYDKRQKNVVGDYVENGQKDISRDGDISKRNQKQTRRETIKSLLRIRGQLTIKDISAVISDCSEKTLQRELVSLIADGGVKRIGERRWSTYALTA